MEVDVWKQLVINAPFAACLVFVFLQFLGHLKWKEQNQDQRNERMAGAIDKLNETLIRVAEKLGAKS